jgi:hypothetical protein
MTAVFNPTQPSQPTLTLPVPATLTPTGGAANPTALPPTSTATTAPAATQTPLPPTPTPVPTNTSAPRPTNTPPPPEERPRNHVLAIYVDDPLDIDGEFDDWGFERYEVEEVVYGEDRWSDGEDLSAWAMFAWDEDYLYIASRVHDDEYVQNARTRELFKGDSLEVLIDTNVPTDFYVRSLSADDFQLGISPGTGDIGDDPEAYLWFPANIEGRRNDVELGVDSVDGGYYVEMAIPWEVFEIEEVDEGDHYGFAFSVSDNDRDSEDVQQSMVSNVPTRNLADPTTWGDLELVD